MMNRVFVNVVIFIYLQIAVARLIQADNSNNNDLDTKKVYMPTLYSDVESILNFLNQPQNIKHQEIQEILDYYYAVKNKKVEFELSGGIKKYPLIAVEGLKGSGKTTMIRGLSEKINASQIHGPTSRVNEIERILEKIPTFQDAIRQLIRFITSLELYQILNESPVVLDRYWDSIAVCSITRKAYYFDDNKLPPKGDKIYNWPADLIKPDIIIFLRVDEDERTRRLEIRNEILGTKLGATESLLKNSREYRNDVYLAYENMNDEVDTYVVDGNQSPEKVLEEVYSKVKPLLKT